MVKKLATVKIRRYPKVLLVTPWFDAASGGGTGTIVSSLCAELKKHLNIKVFVYGWHYNVAKCDQVDGITLEYGRLRPLYDEKNPIKAFVVGFLSLPGSVLLIWRLARRYEVDFFHLHFVSEVCFYFKILRWLGGPKYLITFHGSDVNRLSERHWLSRWLTEFTVNGASRLVAVSESLAGRVKATFPKKDVCVIRNGVSLPRNEEDKNKLNISNFKPFCLCVGGITHVKGHDIAIRAWEKLSKIMPEWHLVIAGDGHSRKEYEELSKSLGCNDRIHWLGFVSSERINALMLEADIMLLPSRNEGLPCVLLEAGYAALPVVASQVGGIPEVVQDGYNGRLVPAEDSEALAKVVMELIIDKPQRSKLGEALKKTILDNFSSEKMAKQYMEIYINLLG